MKVKTIWALMLMVLPGLLFAEASLEDILLKMEEKEKSIQNMTFKFEQETKIISTRRTQSVSGKVVFARPNKMRIEYSGNQKQMIISDGQKVWIYTPAYKQVLVDLWENWVDSSGLPKGLMSFQRYVTDLKDRYEVKLGKSQLKGTHLLHLKPKEKSIRSFSMDLWVSKDSFLPVKTVFSTKSLRVTTDIHHSRINAKKIKPSQFIFVPPKNVQVLELYDQITEVTE